MLEFLKTMQSLRLVVVVMVRNVIFLCSAVFQFVCSPVLSDSYDWMLVTWGCIFPMLCSCAVFSAILWSLSFTMYWVNVQGLWLLFTCVGTVTTSFVGRKRDFCQFYAFCGCFMICLNFNFYGFYALLLKFG